MLSPGCTVGNLKIGKLLGRGAMGEVYSGEQVTLRRPVAIKRIASHLADDPEIIQRFAREAQVVAKVNSPHVVAVYEFGQYTDDQNDKHYLIIMELVEGAYNLKTCIGTEITWQQASSVILQVAEGLASAVEHDVIHRDIKPDNIMLTKKGIAKLADFGLAKSVDSTAMTMEGTLMGTPNYMPPEACRGDMVDAKGDIYSLGATWYHLITGMPLFTAANTMALLRAHCDEAPKPINEIIRDIPQDVADFIMSCVAKDQADRPENAEAIVEFLQKADGVPQKVPELVRIAHAAKERESSSGSTMATIADSGAMDGTLTEGQEMPAATMSAGMAETIVTGAHENPNAAADTLAASPAPTTGSDAQETIAASPAEMTGTAEAPPKSKAGLIVGVCVVLAIAGGAAAFLGGGEKQESDNNKHSTNHTTVKTDVNVQPDTDTKKDDQKPDDTQKADDTKADTAKTADPEVNPKADTEPDQQAETKDLAPMLKAVNEALAAKEYKKAQTAYDALALESDEHVALQTQITDGQAMQVSVAKDASALADKGKIWALSEKLKLTAAYPELAEQHAAWKTKVDAFGEEVQKNGKQLDQLEQEKRWSAASALHRKMNGDADTIGPNAVRKLKEVEARIVPALKAQETLAQELSVLAKAKKLAKLKEVLQKADDYPELAEQKQQHLEIIKAKESQLQSDMSAATTAAGQSKWTAAETALKRVDNDVEIVGSELFEKRAKLAADIANGLKAQEAVAKELSAIHGRGEFITLNAALSKADAFPDLTDTVKGYRSGIKAAAGKARASIAAADKALKSKQYLEAQKHLDAVSTDPKVVAAAQIEQVNKTREAMKKQGAADVTDAINKAVAGVEAGTNEGLQQSGKVLREAMPAAKVSGMEDKLKGVMIKLAEIIEKRSQ